MEINKDASFIFSDTIMNPIYFLYELWIENNKLDYDEIIFNTLTTYINGEINNEHTKIFVNELRKILENNDFNMENNVKINDFDINNDIKHTFLNIWMGYYVKNSDEFERYELLEKILLNCNFVSLEMSKFIWSFKDFRQTIKYFLNKPLKEKYYKGIFKLLFSLTENNNTKNIHNKELYVMDLLQDTSIYDYLIQYIHDMITYDNIISKNPNVLYFNNPEKPFSFEFCIFIMNICNIIHTNQFKNINKKELFENEKLNIIDFKINNLNLYQKIYVTSLYSVNSFINTIWTVIDINLNKNSSINQLKLFINNSWIIDLYLEYFELYDKFNINMYDTFVEFISNLNNNNNILKNDFINNKKIFYVISDIFKGKIQNHHIKYDAFTLMLSLFKKNGYNKFKYILNSLITFIHDISVEKMSFTSIEKKISFQHNITTTLIQIYNDINIDIDNCNCNFYSELIFKIINDSCNLFDYFDERLINEINYHNDIAIIINYYHTTCEIMLFTIMIYENIYNKICNNEKQYLVLKRKIISLIEKVLNNMLLERKNIFFINEHIIMTSFLINKCFKFINNECINNNDFIYEIKNIVLNVINSNIYIINKNVEKSILKYMNSYIEDNNEYPSNFYDPITSKLIIYPVMIPKVNEIFDKICIETHIYNSKINPYTRELLTIDILEEYNKNEDIVKKINSFLTEKQNWKKSQK